MITLTLSAGVPVRFEMQGDFFRLMAATLPLTVNYYRRGARVAEAALVSGGYAEKFGEAFDSFDMTSVSGQTIQFVSRLGNEVRYDTPPNGNVTVTNVNGAFANSQETVTNASTTIIAANALRRYLLIQNNDASGDVYLRLDGGVATTATGIKLKPGESLELQGFVPTGGITAIGSIASNANVVGVEG